ncbi:MAG: ATP-binding protein [Planctomycetota bacterium]
MPAVLIVTRDAVCEQLGTYLASCGYSFEQVSDLEAATYAMRQSTWSCLLVDRRLYDDAASFTTWWENRSGDTRNALCLFSTLEAWQASPLPREPRLDLVVFPELGKEHVLQGIQLAMERQQLHRRFYEVEKLAMLGTVSAGVLHELKNPLNNVLGGMERMLALVEKDSATRRWGNIIQRNGELLRDSLHDLLAGFREEATFTPIQLHPLMDRAVTYALKGEMAYRSITLDRQYLDRDLTVLGSAGHLLHLFLNLLVNARQAIGKQPGTITLRTSQNADQSRVVIDIEDTGPGISPDLEGNLFETIQTTKVEGSGFGLLLCRKIVDRHRGRIEVENLPTRGARFRVHLPTESAKYADASILS